MQAEHATTGQCSELIRQAEKAVAENRPIDPAFSQLIAQSYSMVTMDFKTVQAQPVSSLGEPKADNGVEMGGESSVDTVGVVEPVRTG